MRTCSRTQIQILRAFVENSMAVASLTSQDVLFNNPGSWASTCQTFLWPAGALQQSPWGSRGSQELN